MTQENTPIREQAHRYKKRGFSFEKGIRYFFASNAGLTILILLLIIAFLLKEGLGFFPGYQRELQVYRTAGLEFVDISRKNLTSHEQLTSLLNRAYFAEINARSISQLRRSQESSTLYNSFTEKVNPTRDLVVNNIAKGIDPASNALAVMKANYEKMKADALSHLPETPHLTKEERASLIQSLRNRTLETTEDPEMVTRLGAEYAAARQQHAAPFQALRETIDNFESAGMDLSSLISEMSESTRATKDSLDNAYELEKQRASLLEAAAKAKTPEARAQLTAEAQAILAETPDVTEAVSTLLARKDECIRIQTTLKDAISGIAPKFTADFQDGDARRLLHAAQNAVPVFAADLEKTPAALNDWQQNKAVPLTHAILSFLTGKDWITGGEWQDFYGILPLLIGSVMISIVALVIAIPTGIGAAIYTNQFASKREQAIVKPVIEFIQAIPSVVLGFIGILVFGTVLRDLSMADSLSWVPGFPIEERLNIFTAGCLLALMSIPTIFSLAEDALNNVPGAYSEASEALGASRIQTVFRVVVPAAFSGILAAVLLGLGRVIGETMVVLLVAGNRIKIPDFSSGLGTFFQPAHTLTGIIAQELGEVPLGSVHYRALFVVGILLFGIVLLINATAHKFVNRQKH